MRIPLTQLCEGVCDDGCTGDARRVHIAGAYGRDWGYFMYCDMAVKTDRERGLVVTDSPLEATGEPNARD